ncbi:hypothetical protein ABH900_003015 [Stenotrophomonas sp. AN71]|uniref:hypothetical protein n=1 Tax=Stenotrophomonas sp. AN71 TaxID=3156253 RepID=UPI003D1EDA45
MNLASWRNILIAAGVAVALSIAAYNDHRRHSVTHGAEGRDAVGLVTEVQWDEKRGRKSNFVLQVEFETDDGESRVEKIPVSNDLGNRMRATDEAEEIDIRYNAKDPSVAMAAGEADNSLLKLWLAIASGLVTLALLAARVVQGRKVQPA